MPSSPGSLSGRESAGAGWEWEECLPEHGTSKFVSALQLLGIELAEAVPQKVFDEAISTEPPISDLIIGKFGKKPIKERLLIKNFWAIHTLVKFQAFRTRKPSKAEIQIILTAFNERHQGLAIRACPEYDLDTMMESVGLKLQRLWSGLRRKWQNSKHSSGSAWVQVLKDCMKNHSANPKGEYAELDAETDILGHQSTSDSDDAIPDDFFGVIDQPQHDDASSPTSNSDCGSDVWKCMDGDKLASPSAEESHPPHSSLVLYDPPGDKDSDDELSKALGALEDLSPVRVDERRKRERARGSKEKKQRRRPKRTTMQMPLPPLSLCRVSLIRF